MNHSDIRNHLADYIEGDLDLSRRALLDAHFDRCEDCAREMDELRATIALLHSLPAPEPPPELAERVMRRIRAGEGRPLFLDSVRDFLSTLSAPRFAVPLTALATLAAIALLPGELRLQIPGFSAGSTEGVIASQPRPAASDEVALEARGLAAADAAPSRELLDKHRELTESALARLVASRESAVRPPLEPSSRLERPGPVLAATPQQGQLSGMPPYASPEDRAQHRLELLDSRLQLMISDATLFAGRFGERSLAEQELWLRELAARSLDVEIADAVEQSLRASSDPAADALADSFALAVVQARASQAIAEEEATSE